VNVVVFCFCFCFRFYLIRRAWNWANEFSAATFSGTQSIHLFIILGWGLDGWHFRFVFFKWIELKSSYDCSAKFHLIRFSCIDPADEYFLCSVKIFHEGGWNLYFLLFLATGWDYVENCGILVGISLDKQKG